jgi:hypothetical protein
MTIPLKYATASQEVPLGFFVDSTDGNTEETGLTIRPSPTKTAAARHTSRMVSIMLCWTPRTPTRMARW